MRRIDVLIDEEQESIEKVDDLKTAMEENQLAWKAELEMAAQKQTKIMACPAFVCSETMSDNFQVIGAWLRTVHTFQRQNPYPEEVKIKCPNIETARTYKRIYNFFIAETKQDRLPDDDWD